jgi:hypothetical protein
MQTEYLVTEEKHYKQARQRAAETPDASSFDREIETVRKEIAVAERALLMNKGRRWFGLKTFDETEARQVLTLKKAQLDELLAKQEEARWQREAIATALPDIEARAREVVGKRLIAEARRHGVQLTAAVDQLHKLVDEAEPLADAIERQFTETTVSGFSRNFEPLRGAGPILGLLRFWSRDERGDLKSRIERWREVCRACDVKV